MEFKYIVEEIYHGKSIAEILKLKFQISSLLLKKIRLHGVLLVNGLPKRMIDPAYTGDFILAQPSTDPDDFKPFKMNALPNIEILYEDEHLAVLNKPANLVVHATFSHPENTLIDQLSDRRLHVVTRLDRETSGAMIIAKHSHAHYRLMQRPMHKVYWALTHGIWQKKRGEINAPILRSPDSIMIRQVDSDGKEAITLYVVRRESSLKNFSLVEFQLLTGRTHQIRVHSLYMAHPLLADGLYGIADYMPGLILEKKVIPIQKDLCRIQQERQQIFLNLLNESQYALDCQIKRQALHARCIGFYHPISEKYMEFTADPPEDMKILLEDPSLLEISS